MNSIISFSESSHFEALIWELLHLPLLAYMLLCRGRNCLEVETGRLQFSSFSAARGLLLSDCLRSLRWKDEHGMFSVRVMVLERDIGVFI